MGSVFRIFLSSGHFYRVAYSIFILISLHSLLLLGRWAWFGGVPPFNGPTFDGPTLSNAVAGVSLGVAIFLGKRNQKRLWRLTIPFLIASNAALVLLAWRRTYWMELLITIGVLTILYNRNRLRIIGFATISVVVILLTFPKEAIWARVMSAVNLFDETNPYSSTNIGHVEDVLDAMLQIQRSPILGIGLGTTYETIYTRWKTESWGVHNGPLHVWLRFGLLGLLAYLWFHWRVISFLWSHRQLVLTRGLLAYWLGIFIPTLFFSPWPYGALQNTLLLGVLFALVDVEVTYWRRII
ncbi:O-antigen ligase family protein [Rhodothermus bifroesti]